MTDWAYRALPAEHGAAAEVACWIYTLMPNHVHLILVPADEDGLRRALGEAHHPAHQPPRGLARPPLAGALPRLRHGPGVRWAHLLAAARYVELNPLRAPRQARPALALPPSD